MSLAHPAAKLFVGELVRLSGLQPSALGDPNWMTSVRLLCCTEIEKIKLHVFFLFLLKKWLLPLFAKKQLRIGCLCKMFAWNGGFGHLSTWEYPCDALDESSLGHIRCARLALWKAGPGWARQQALQCCVCTSKATENHWTYLVLYTLSHQELAGKPFPSVQMFDDFPLLLYTSVRLPLVDPHRLA